MKFICFIIVIIFSDIKCIAQFSIDSTYTNYIDFDSLNSYVIRTPFDSKYDSSTYYVAYKNGIQVVQKYFGKKGTVLNETLQYGSLSVSIDYDDFGLGIHRIKIIEDSTQLLCDKEFSGPNNLLSESFGFPCGTHLTYYENTRDIKLLYEYCNGIYDGIFIEYYSNGGYKSLGYFEKGKRIGDMYQFTENGGLSSHSIFEDGELIKKYDFDSK